MANTKQKAVKARRLFTDEAYEILKRRILDNEWPAGHLALEQELAAELGMSRTPIREALIRLEKEGLVEVRPRHGMRVLGISAEDMEEIYEILTCLESMAAELVAKRGLTDQQRAELNAAVNDMDTALAQDNLETWAKADERFHKLLVDYCGNRRLKSLVEGCFDQAHRARLLTLKLRPKPTSSNEDHRATVNAIERRDPTAAREIHRLHRMRAGEMLVEILNKHGLSSL
ncbi:MAG: GntR family transcriptional regulator [Arenicellales bacterium]|nr:GntR family transcriptional regulator [Arenicellales bacterium]